MLSSFTDEFILKLIYDEQGNVIGEFPLVKLTIGKIDERDDLSYESFHVSINSLKTLGDQFLKSYKDNIMHGVCPRDIYHLMTEYMDQQDRICGIYFELPYNFI